MLTTHFYLKWLSQQLENKFSFKYIISTKFFKTSELLPIPRQLSSGLILHLVISDIGQSCSRMTFNAYWKNCH